MRIEPRDAFYLGGARLNAYIYRRLVFLEKRSEGTESRFRNLCMKQCLNSQPPIVHWLFWMGSREEEKILTRFILGAQLKDKFQLLK